jgi:hypothetical protein
MRFYGDGNLDDGDDDDGRLTGRTAPRCIRSEPNPGNLVSQVLRRIWEILVACPESVRRSSQTRYCIKHVLCSMRSE